MRLTCAAVFVVFLFCSLPAQADDYGPHPDIRDVTFAAKRLLAHRLREAKIDPSAAVISDIIVVKDQAILSWRVSADFWGVMGLVRYADRWWDAFAEVGPISKGHCAGVSSEFPLKDHDPSDAVPIDPRDVGMSSGLVQIAALHNAQFKQFLDNKNPGLKGTNEVYYGCSLNRFLVDTTVPTEINRRGGDLFPWWGSASSYDVALQYTANDAALARFTNFRFRAPSPGEIIGYPTPPRGAGGSQSVVFLYIDVDSKAPVAFEKGSKLSIWVPYVLDDQIEYDLNLYSTSKAVGLFKGTIFDNVVTFDLPAFTLQPGETQGEVDGYW